MEHHYCDDWVREGDWRGRMGEAEGEKEEAGDSDDDSMPGLSAASSSSSSLSETLAEAEEAVNQVQGEAEEDQAPVDWGQVRRERREAMQRRFLPAGTTPGGTAEAVEAVLWRADRGETVYLGYDGEERGAEDTGEWKKGD